MKYLKLSNEDHHLFIFLTRQCSWLPVLLFQTFLMIPKRESQGNIICHLHKDHVFLQSTTFKSPEQGPFSTLLTDLFEQTKRPAAFPCSTVGKTGIPPMLNPFRMTASLHFKRHNEYEVTVNDLLYISF